MKCHWINSLLNILKIYLNYDQHRLTKFSTLQHILNTLFLDEYCSKGDLYHFIEGQVKNEQLF
jgi:hypothetical protein